MNIYIVCPVRHVSFEQTRIIEMYVEKLEDQGHEVHYPPRNVDQSDPIGFNIVSAHKTAMELCDEVHIFWDSTSSGSHFDLGMAIALGKKLKLVKAFTPDTLGKSFLKVIKEVIAHQK